MDSFEIDISVIMAVFNGEAKLRDSVESVLGQKNVSLEFIIINDGSIDNSTSILEEYAKSDNRIRLYHRDHQGLTKSLIFGCSVAQSEYIARQDVGDLSYPDRLNIQKKLFDKNPDAVLVACGTEFVTPSNEFLFEVTFPGEELSRGLNFIAGNQFKGPPHHGGTMFRRDAYNAVGGYRPEFTVAQDVDLWLRLNEVGSCLGNTETLYKAHLYVDGISAKKRPQQNYFRDLALEAARLRSAGIDDSALLRKVIPPLNRKVLGLKTIESDYFYYLASILIRSNRTAAEKYIRQSIGANPLNLRAQIRNMIWKFL